MDDRRQWALSLRSRSPSERARVVQSLMMQPQELSTRDLLNALQAETVPRIRNSLLQILELRQSPPDGPIHREPSTEQREPRADGGVETFDIASMIRHELSPAIGWIRLAADAEIADFGNSKTNSAIQKLQRRIDGLVTIIKADETLRFRNVGLRQAIGDNWPDHASPPSIVPADSDQADIEIKTDEGLYSILLSNIFQNAIDASKTSKGVVDVRVTWGYTDRNYWIRVVNPFEGDRLRLSDVIDVGSSSKAAHQGHGMALISEVANLLKIKVSLEGSSGIASFSLSGAREDA